MSRTLNANTKTALEATTVSPRIMIKAMFDTPVYVWTGEQDKSYNSNTYIGGGSIIGFDGVEETSDMGATGITLTLALSSDGVTSDLLTKAITDDYQGNSITIYLATVAQQTENFLGAPVQLFNGYIDQMTAQDDGEVAVLTLTAESNLLRLGRTFTRVYTDEDQKYHFPDDKGLEFVAAIQEQESIWGRNA